MIGNSSPTAPLASIARPNCPAVLPGIPQDRQQRSKCGRRQRDRDRQERPHEPGGGEHPHDAERRATSTRATRRGGPPVLAHHDHAVELEPAKKEQHPEPTLATSEIAVEVPRARGPRGRPRCPTRSTGPLPGSVGPGRRATISGVTAAISMITNSECRPSGMVIDASRPRAGGHAVSRTARSTACGGACGRADRDGHGAQTLRAEPGRGKCRRTLPAHPRRITPDQPLGAPGRRRALEPGLGRVEQHADDAADQDQVQDHLHAHDDARRVGGRRDVAEARPSRTP